LLSDNWWKDNIARTNKKCKSHKTQGNNIPCTEIRHKWGEELKKSDFRGYPRFFIVPFMRLINFSNLIIH
jgi:CDP-diacylglycerol pyrophosphatase